MTLSLSTAAFSSITVKVDAAAAALHLTEWVETNNMDVGSLPLVRERKKAHQDVRNNHSCHHQRVYIDHKMTFVS